MSIIPDSKVHGANMGPIWGQQGPGGPHVGPMNFAIWDGIWNHKQPFPLDHSNQKQRKYPWITDSLSGESTGGQWNPLTKGQ